MASARDIHQQFVAAFNNRDFTTFQNMLAPDYVYVGADGQELKGPQAGVAAAQGFLAIFPDAQSKILSLYEDDNTSVGEFQTTGTQKNAFMGIPATNKSVTTAHCNIIRIRNGLIYSEHDYTNMLAILLQLGASVQPPSGS